MTGYKSKYKQLVKKLLSAGVCANSEEGLCVRCGTDGVLVILPTIGVGPQCIPCIDIYYDVDPSMIPKKPVLPGPPGPYTTSGDLNVYASTMGVPEFIGGKLIPFPAHRDDIPRSLVNLVPLDLAQIEIKVTSIQVPGQAIRFEIYTSQDGEIWTELGSAGPSFAEVLPQIRDGVVRWFGVERLPNEIRFHELDVPEDGYPVRTGPPAARKWKRKKVLTSTGPVSYHLRVPGEQSPEDTQRERPLACDIADAEREQLSPPPGADSAGSYPHATGNGGSSESIPGRSAMSDPRAASGEVLDAAAVPSGANACGPGVKPAPGAGGVAGNRDPSGDSGPVLLSPEIRRELERDPE